jgi:hypothetical protein
VEPKWKEILTELYKQTLRDLTLVPEGPYLDLVKRLTEYRLDVVTKNDDWKVVEETIACGQVEELVCGPTTN